MNSVIWEQWSSWIGAGLGVGVIAAQGLYESLKRLTLRECVRKLLQFTLQCVGMVTVVNACFGRMEAVEVVVAVGWFLGGYSVLLLCLVVARRNVSEGARL